ncbi:MAG: DUF2264 domain-containing protein [Verrucomicrobia bacterium]|nr:DUF2264 domain-containing protein [Verrucomicrobiota bacterium]
MISETILNKPRTETIANWLRGIAAPLLPPLKGDNAPLLAHPSEYGALSDRIEAFSRPLLAVAPWLSDRAIAKLPKASSYAAAARATLLRGTDPADPDYFGPMQDKYQPICEQSAIAWCLHNARNVLWEPLSQGEKDQVAAWLADVEGHEVSDTNWHLFPAVTLAFLRKEGYPVDETEVNDHIRRVYEDFIGECGWYKDGDEPAYDTYNGNQMQPYMQMLDELGALSDEWSEEARRRVVDWANSLLYFFDEEGVAPFWGRSVVYRANYLDGVAMAFRRGLPVAKAGDWRRAVEGVCRYFDLDAIQGADGYLLSGFLGKKEDVLDWYSCRASAYWLGRNCHFIQIPEDSAFWTEEPSEWKPGLVHLDPLPMALNRNPRHVVLWNLGITHHAYADSKYHNLFFSGRFGQIYDSGAAALSFLNGREWKRFNSWNPVNMGAHSATVMGHAGEIELQIRFERTTDGDNLVEITHMGGAPVNLRLGGFAVSGNIKPIDNGLEGVEGQSILKPISGFQSMETQGNDGTHLWAPEFSYPVSDVMLTAGKSASAIIAGYPGDWAEVLKLHGGE